MLSASLREGDDAPAGLVPAQVEQITEVLGDGDSDGKMISRDSFRQTFRMHGLTNLEIMEVFTMADVNKDGALSADEWRAFHRFFIKSYNECADAQYRMTHTEIQCVFAHPYFKSMAVEGSIKKTFEGFGTNEVDPEEGEAEKGDGWNAKQILLAVDRDLDGKMNLAE